MRCAVDISFLELGAKMKYTLWHLANSGFKPDRDVMALILVRIVLKMAKVITIHHAPWPGIFSPFISQLCDQNGGCNTV
ncbi:hypothetical protein Y032_0017g3255 [Ancylostoma ceylanicum]|uniref:Uncharacterized protein n=1 Tax=Ancylostoma ceylanicum TaxID=53326 RepID=A0A016V481_9BILA|nr:hypothetical protein Y032_0017g3255 [Ancylostoma ceylanicum]